jgi:hypothetical protein
MALEIRGDDVNDCQFCVHDHAPAEGYPGKCPFYGTAWAWKPARPRPLSIENQSAFAMREIKAKIDEENLEFQRKQERLDREETLKEAKAQAARREMTDFIHEAERAKLAEVHESIEVQTRARRLELKLARRADQGGGQ